MVVHYLDVTDLLLLLVIVPRVSPVVECGVLRNTSKLLAITAFTSLLVIFACLIADFGIWTTLSA